MRVDLHIHTIASDGRWTPEQVVTGCAAEGIELLAIADHDAVASVLPAKQLAREAGLGFIPAVEVTALNEAHGLLHILGYGIDPTEPHLLEMLEENRTKLEATDDADIRQLIKLGYDIDWDDYEAYTYDRTRGGFKSLNYLIDQGFCTGPADFFVEIRSKLNNPWPDFADPARAVAVIREAGGVPVLAHPGATFKDRGGVTRTTLDPLLPLGIAGLECYSQYHDPATTETCLTWCRKHDLLITGGSDYHGGFVGRQLGVPVVDISQLRLNGLIEE